MIISFDIDRTLIPYGDEFEVKTPSWFFKILGAEGLRIGTKQLFKSLEKEGHEIWVYTTSFRSHFALSLTFRSRGLAPKRFINEKTNRQKLNAAQCSASKNPKLFGIDLHIDDAEGVKLEGETFGFKTLIISPQDDQWAETVVKEISLLTKLDSFPC